MSTTNLGKARRFESVAVRGLSRVAARVLLPAVVVVGILVVLVYAVLPTRTWLDQRDAIARSEVKMVELDELNDVLVARVAALRTEAEIERIAREDHGLVRPGEEAYAVLPPAPAPIRLPLVWPFTELARILRP